MNKTNTFFSAYKNICRHFFKNWRHFRVPPNKGRDVVVGAAERVVAGRRRVRGSVGGNSMFMAQAGALVVCGDAGEALGDSLYEARIYVRGSVAGLGADCIEKEMREEHLAQVRDLLERAGIDDVEPRQFRRYGSARQLYTFKIDNAGVY